MRVFKKIIIIFIFFITFFIGTKNTYAAYFRFDPSSVNSSSGNNFEVKVILEPGSDQIYSTDIYINYDSSLLKVINVKAENLFPTVSNDISANGKVYIAAMVNDPTSYVSSAGPVATITFQGLKDGSGNLSFDCNNSKIIKNDVNGTNVLNCNQNSSASITIGAGGSTTTNNQSSNNSSTDSLPQSLPQTGVFDNVVKFGIPGMILLLLGSILRIVI